MELNDELKDLESRIYNSDDTYNDLDTYKEVEYTPVDDSEDFDDVPSSSEGYRSQFSELKSSSASEDIIREDEEKPYDFKSGKKKKGALQKTIIIAACILLTAVIAFFVYYAFFAHSIVGDWDYKSEDLTYHYKFKNDGTVTMSLGSVEFVGQYATESNTEGGMNITVNLYYGEIGGEMTYEITGSRILGNQVLTLKNGATEQTLTQSTQVNFKKMLDVPEENKIDENLIGEWEYTFEDYGGITYKFIFNKDGTMQINQYDSVIYNCVYSADGSNINCSFLTTEETTQDIPYTCDGTTLDIMGLKCLRSGAATADQAAAAQAQ